MAQDVSTAKRRRNICNVDKHSSIVSNPMNKLTAKFNRQNMLRELTTLMQSYDEPLTFESLNSR
eukprot:scaffold7737_cov180-Skeletonema_marinoi.AAC.1